MGVRIGYLFAGVNDQLFGSEVDDILFAGKVTPWTGDGQDQFWTCGC